MRRGAATHVGPRSSTTAAAMLRYKQTSRCFTRTSLMLHRQLADENVLRSRPWTASCGSPSSGGEGQRPTPIQDELLRTSRTLPRSFLSGIHRICLSQLLTMQSCELLRHGTIPLAPSRPRGPSRILDLYSSFSTAVASGAGYGQPSWATSRRSSITLRVRTETLEPCTAREFDDVVAVSIRAK